jgi:acyl-CoA thioester hydrolase
MTNYPLKLNLRIDWSEMDLFGHVNNVAYFKYIQAARVNYWEKMGLTNMFKEQSLGPILASSACNFIRPLHYPGNLTVQSGVDSIGNSSFVILHQILDGTGTLCAEAKDVVVLFDFKGNKKMAVPEEIRNMIESMEASARI